MRKEKITPGRIISDIFLFLLLLIVIVPFLWMVVTSLQPGSAAVLTRPFKLPWPPAFHNYAEAWHMEPFGIYARNSIFISVVTMMLQVVMAVMAAYALVFLRIRGRNFIIMAILAVMMMPSQVSIIPLYATMSKLGWLNTFKALIIPFSVDAYGIFMIRQNFSTIPRDYVEAATIEGAGHCRIAFSIMPQLSLPSLIAFAIMAFKWRWNDYFWVLVMTSSIEKRTLPVGIAMMKEVSDGGTQWHLLMAASVFVLLPMIVLYLCLQKYFTNDYLKGGLKG